MGVTMTVTDMRQWLQQAASTLADARVVAVLAQGPRLGAGDGSTWISFTSPTGSARLIRATDGSGTCRALRHRDGVAILDEHHGAVGEDHLNALVRLLAHPAGRTSAQPS
jgi:hypothetical protein